MRDVLGILFLIYILRVIYILKLRPIVKRVGWVRFITSIIILMIPTMLFMGAMILVIGLAPMPR